MTAPTPDFGALSLAAHLLHHGKLEVRSKVPLLTRDDLSTYYSPGVAAPCLEIARNPSAARDLTRKHNTVAVISDWSAVLGLGNIGGLAGLPVMEGKAILFKEFANVDAVPIVLGTQDVEEVIRTIVAIAPTFGGINLEDFKAPECFVIESRLKELLDIPVFHDDQHGTAIVALAGLINSLKLTGKRIQDIKIVVTGAGAAGIAIVKLLALAGAQHIVMLDSRGAIHEGRDDLNEYKASIHHLNRHQASGSLSDVIVWADVFMGLSQPDILTPDDVRSMADKPIIFAMANPNPEISPDLAYAAGAYIVATGRSDYPNQLNNVLVFPGIFRGVLDAGISAITDAHKLAAAHALADYVTDLRPDHIIPSPLDKKVAFVIAEAVKRVS